MVVRMDRDCDGESQLFDVLFLGGVVDPRLEESWPGN